MHSIWDATLGRLVQTYFHEQQPTDVSFTTQHGASGSVPLIVTASADGVVRAWDTRDRPENSGVYSFNHQHAVRQLVFTGDSTIISFGAQHTRIWDSRMVAERVFDHIGTTYVRELPGSVLADAKLGKIVLMSDAGSLSVYDTRTGNALHDFGAGHVRTARVLRTDGSTVVTGNSSGTVSVWDTPGSATLLPTALPSTTCNSTASSCSPARLIRASACLIFEPAIGTFLLH